MNYYIDEKTIHICCLSTGNLVIGSGDQGAIDSLQNITSVQVVKWEWGDQKAI